MNNNESEEEINDAINNYITYSREYLLLAHNMLAFTSRNDERLHNLMSLYVRNNQIHNQIHRNNDPIINNTSIPAPSMTNNMHRNNNSNRNRRTNNSRTPTRNVRHRTTYNRNNMSLPSGVLHSGFNRPHNTFNTLFTGTTNPININNERLDADRGLSEIFLQAINGLNNLESVPIFPTDEQINTACEDVSFNIISNPINNSCPINLERFTINSTVTQILYCGHCYDPTALRRWFRTNVRCPICRYDIRNYNPMDIIRNPYRRILNNPNLGPIERPNQSSPIVEPTAEIHSEPAPTPNSEPTIIPNSEPTLDINIESTILNDTDLSFSSLPENNNILHENNEIDSDDEYNVNNFINNNVNNNVNNNEIANIMRDNLNSMIINDLSNNLNNANLIFSDLSNNGQGPIIDLSYQIVFN